jgi:hypothetical protein
MPGFDTLKLADAMPILKPMQEPNWESFDLEKLGGELRAKLPAPEAEKILWAFEQALSVARIDGDLLRYLLAATVSLVARANGTTPRTVLEDYFRRSVSDDEWRDRYLELLA